MEKHKPSVDTSLKIPKPDLARALKLLGEAKLICTWLRPPAQWSPALLTAGQLEFNTACTAICRCSYPLPQTYVRANVAQCEAALHHGILCLRQVELTLQSANDV